MHTEFFGGSFVKWLLEKLRRILEVNVEMDLEEIDFGDWRWMELAQDWVQCWVLLLPVLNL